MIAGFGRLVAPSPAAAQTGSEGDENVSFNWAFGALVGSGAEQRLEPIRRDTALKSGDQLKMLVTIEKKCFVYVFYQNPQGELKMLFPYSLQQFAANYDVGTKYYIPQGEGWFRLDEHTGSETIHLIASAHRLASLEDLWSQYEKAQGVHKPAIGKLIVAEIRKIKKQNRELTAPVERPVAIGGNIRGVRNPGESNPLDVASIADEIRANGFYGRAFTIDHQ